MDAPSSDLAADLKVNDGSFPQMFIPLPAVSRRSCPAQGMDFIPSLLKFIAIAVANTLLAAVWLLLSVLTALFHLVLCSTTDHPAVTPEAIRAAAARNRNPRRQNSAGSATSAASGSSAATDDSGDATLRYVGLHGDKEAGLSPSNKADLHKEHLIYSEEPVAIASGSARSSRRPCVRRLLNGECKLTRLHTSPGSTQSMSSLPNSPILPDTASTISASSHPGDISQGRTRFPSFHVLHRTKSTPDESGKPFRGRCIRQRHTLPPRKQPRPVPRTDPYQAPYFFPSPMSPGAADYVRQVKTERSAPSRSASTSSGQAERSISFRRSPEARPSASASPSPIRHPVDLPEVNEPDDHLKNSRRRSWHLHLPLHANTHRREEVRRSSGSAGC
ncbi:hypothetical protein OBBRIDRAFT_154834 [Obba rivulosa]|uniref:Uncharacterized protein n=1 Tax=Obba rivulosa TaxID=1052685 RepID=A0A8E2ANI8_9APHY|nr:hypothetical protein OBBRIDRAFT_154834 [Obba rivulosa]